MVWTIDVYDINAPPTSRRPKHRAGCDRRSRCAGVTPIGIGVPNARGDHAVREATPTTPQPLHANCAANRRPWLILALICVPVFIGSLDLTIVSAFLPEIIVKLELPVQSVIDDAAWVVTGYLLAYTDQHDLHGARQRPDRAAARLTSPA